MFPFTVTNPRSRRTPQFNLGIVFDCDVTESLDDPSASAAAAGFTPACCFWWWSCKCAEDENQTNHKDPDRAQLFKVLTIVNLGENNKLNEITFNNNIAVEFTNETLRKQ